jgi:hypothetical protein
MGLLTLLLLLPADEPAENLAKQMLPIYVKEAAEYAMAVESAPRQALELKKEPVFEWSNPVREGVQQGVVFLWLRDGRPAALGSIFSQPAGGKQPGRRIMHEFHALDREKLLVSRPPGALNEWKPEAGLERKELADAGTPATTVAARLLQMKRLAQEFTGHEEDSDGKRWDLRLLPAPLYRYPMAKTGVLDGALFTLVSSAGTDPEVLLLLEAREDGGKTRWEYVCARFSDRNLYVQRKEQEIWTSVRRETDTQGHDTRHLYRLYGDKVVDTDGKLLARMRSTEKIWWGEVIPVPEK